MTAAREIVSVQSRVMWGYVGNAVAVPTCQAFGVHAWPVDTVRLAHHPGHGPVEAAVTDPSELGAALTCVLARTSPNPILLAGYLGSAAQGDVLIEIAETSGRNPCLILDPAFGDSAEGVYVDPAIVDFHKRAAGKADWLMPNAFELSVLSGRPVSSVAEAEAAAESLLERGAGGIVATSVPDGPEIANLLVRPGGTELFRVPRRDLRAKGTGDMLSAAFGAGIANGREPAGALAAAVEAVAAAVEISAAHNATELDIPEILPKICVRAERTRE